MHTPILIFFTCIAKKQISKLHNIVLLHKKIEYVPKKIQDTFINWNVYILSTFVEKTIYLPLYIFFYFFLHIFFLHHFFQLDTGWTNLLKEPNTFASSFTLPPYWLLFRIQQKPRMEIFSSDLNDVMLIFVLTLHARTRKLYYYLMCRGMRRCD